MKVAIVSLFRDSTIAYIDEYFQRAEAITHANMDLEWFLVGAGAVLKESIHIGGDVIIGAGAVVVKDVPHGCIVTGNPAKIRWRDHPHVGNE